MPNGQSYSFAVFPTSQTPRVPLLTDRPLAGFEVVAERVWDAPGAYPAFDPPEVRRFPHDDWLSRPSAMAAVVMVQLSLCSSVIGAALLYPRLQPCPPLPSAAGLCTLQAGRWVRLQEMAARHVCA